MENSIKQSSSNTKNFQDDQKEQSLKLTFSLSNKDKDERVKYIPDSEISTCSSFHKGTWCKTIFYAILLFSWLIVSIVLTYYEVVTYSYDKLNWIFILTVYSAITILFT